jgi:hypothetical protein
MAIISSTLLEDGPRNVVISLTGNLESGDYEKDALKVNVKELSIDGANNIPKDLSVLGIKFSTTNIEVALQWESNNNDMFYVLPAYFSSKVDFKHFGGIFNNAPGKTGNILLTTKSRTIPALDAQYMIVLWLKKRYS